MAGGLAQEELKRMGDSASNMSALEVAAMGKFLHAQKMSMEQDESASAVQLEMDAKDRDWQPLIEEAKGTWQGVGSLFAKKVDFTLHGTHFLGKAGYSVKSGVVPLFDGAALDLKFAKLEATKTQDVPPGFENWVEAKGSGGMLVLAPVGMDNVVPISMEDVVVTEQGLSGSAKKHMEFRAGQHRLTAESLSLSTEAAQLFGVTETEDAQSEPVKRQSAKITGQGITVTKAAEPQGKQEEQKKQEEQGSGEQDREEKKTGDAGAIRHVSEPEPTPEPKPDPQPKPKPDEQTDQNETPEKKEEEKEEEKKEEEEKKDEDGGVKGFLKEAGSNFGKAVVMGKKDDDDDDSKHEMEAEKNLDIKKGNIAFGVALKDKEEDNALKQGFDAAVTTAGDATHQSIANLFKKGADPKEPFVNLYEQGKEIVQSIDTAEAKEKGIKVLNTIGDMRNRTVTEKEVENVMGDLQDALSFGSFQELLGLDSDSDEEDEKKNTKKLGEAIPLLSIELFPGISFKITLTPEITFHPYAYLQVDNLWNIIKNKKRGEKTPVAFEAGISSNLSLEAAAGFEEGIPYLIRGYQKLSAKASLEGNTKAREGEQISHENVALRGSIETEIERGQDGSLRFPDLSKTRFDIAGGYDLVGSFLFTVGAESKILSWDKKFVEKTLGKWTLATIGMNLKISKDNGVKGLLRGWTLDETGIEMKRGSGMGKAFTDANPQSENYGLYPPEKEESKTYSDLQTNFRKALELLEQFADNAAQGMLLIPTGSDKSGLSDTAAGLAELVRQFGALWAQSQRALEEADDALEAYKNSKLIGLQASENMTLIDRHARRLDAMKKWNAQYKPGKEPKNYAQQTWEYYKSLSGNPGIGFGRYLEKKTEDIVYTFPKISIYEKERFKALTDKYTERIYLVEELAGKNWEVTWKAMAEDERKKKDKEIREAYEGKGGEAYDHRSLVQDKEVLIKFLQKKKDELVEPLTEQKTRAEELSKGKKADNEKDRAAFFKKFADKLDKTKHKEILFMFGNSGLLLNYEKKRVQQKRTIVNTLTDDDDSIAYMKEYQSDLPAKDRSEEQQKLLRTEYYKAATIDDLIEFETENNLGTGGKRLLRYLETGDKVRQGGALLDQILGDSKEHALSDFKERLAAREKDENLKFMSLEDIKKHLSYSDENREKQESFLEQSRLILAAEADPKKRKEMETEEVKAYFNRFAKEAQNYQENLGSGKEINLELMKDVLLHNEKNERMKMLQEAKKKGLSDAQVNQEYNKKYSDQQDALRWFLQRKYPDKGAEQIKNFYRVKLRERNEKHLDRLLKLEELTAKGANYRTMLDEYGKLGGGEEYAESIRKELLDNRGVVDGVKFKMETAQKIASESIETVGKAFNSSIEDIKKKSEAGVDDATLLRNFDEKKKDDWGMIKKVTGFLGVNWRSELEKSLSEESLTPGQLILYEKLERDRAGKAHEERLKALYGVEELPEDISKLSTPSQAVWDERVSAYRERAKRFKSQDEAKDLMGHVENYMKNSSGLGGQIVEYEEGRLSHYKEKLTELTQVQLDLQERCRVVREQMDLSSDMVENLDKIQNKPGVIYAKIAEFKKAVNWTEKDEAKQKQEGAENAKVLNKSAELLKKDDDEEE